MLYAEFSAMDYTLNIVSKYRFFFIFKHLRAPNRSCKIFHGVLESPGKVLDFFVSKRVGTLWNIVGTVAVVCMRAYIHENLIRMMTKRVRMRVIQQNNTMKVMQYKVTMRQWPSERALGVDIIWATSSCSLDHTRRWVYWVLLATVKVKEWAARALMWDCRPGRVNEYTLALYGPRIRLRRRRFQYKRLPGRERERESKRAGGKDDVTA